MPRRRPELEPADREIYQLERKVVEFRRRRDDLLERAQFYKEVRLREHAERKEEQAHRYDERILELEEQIEQLKRESVFERVQE